MRRLLRVLMLIVGIGVVYYGLKNIPIKNLSSKLLNTGIYVDREKTTIFEDWSELTVLNEINFARKQFGLSELKVNTNLSKAAHARLSVIMFENDYDGKITGVSREAAVQNSGYKAKMVGDLVLLDFFKTNDPIKNWGANEITKETLYTKEFRELGIAVKNEEERVHVYVLLASPQSAVKSTVPITTPTVSWGGPELWNAINKRRVEMGVNPLSQKSELCTIASIRLNQLLEMNKLDGHAGFGPVLERQDLKWISEKYNISEYLAQGYPTPAETVKAWENTMGHRALLAGGEYVWGCVYSQATFAVAIAAY